MTIGWEQAEKLSNKALESAGIYLRLANDGDKAVVAFCGEPYAREVHWTGAAYEECQGEGCPHCAAGIKVTVRVACNTYVPADKAMKIFEGGPRWFGDLLRVRKKYGLDGWAFEIERHGAAKSPKTTYTILPEEPLDPAQRAHIAELELHDLARDTRAAAEAAFAEERAAEATAQVTGGPIDTDVARELHEQLRTMPRDEVANFFRTFGVNRVSLLQAEDEERARAFISDKQELAF